MTQSAEHIDAGRGKDKPLTVSEAAQRIGVSSGDVYGYIRTGQLKAWKKQEDPESPKPRYRIQAEWLDEFLEARMVVHVPKPKPRRHTARIERFF